MHTGVITKEWPPAVYGGAGVHVVELVRALRAAGHEVDVHAFGEPEPGPGVHGHVEPPDLAGANAALRTLGVDLRVAAAVDAATAAGRAPQLLHSHTWYANLGGHLAARLVGVPHVVTAHSLEPMRPWKAEQLGGGYRISSWAEETAYRHADAVIAVSAGMRADILASYPFLEPERVPVVHNGIDADDWQRDEGTDVVERLGMVPGRPAVVFVGRITRQKGLPYLLRACASLPPEVQVVLLAGAPDTPEIAAEVRGLVDTLREGRDGVVWVEQMLPRPDVCQVLSHATVFVCPSVYEPLGIVNLEAMACGAAVVGTATGGIPEVVDDGRTGWLVPIEQVGDGTGTPVDPDRFVADLARTLVDAVADPAEARRRGAAGRERAVAEFSWHTVAERTVAVYEEALSRAG
ncbi:glycogen synthase [Aquipuribacter nitratireducens]|uniref:Glycogen synthase n=1 Tax=Aquipuribacter nitratireducens TaxID=650104 RepID=A0ABW0GIP1_9MICO